MSLIKRLTTVFPYVIFREIFNGFLILVGFSMLMHTTRIVHDTTMSNIIIPAQDTSTLKPLVSFLAWSTFHSTSQKWVVMEENIWKVLDMNWNVQRGSRCRQILRLQYFVDTLNNRDVRTQEIISSLHNWNSPWISYAWCPWSLTVLEQCDASRTEPKLAKRLGCRRDSRAAIRCQ